MSSQKKSLAQELCKSIVTSTERSGWEKQIKACIKDADKIEKLQSLNGVAEMAAEHELELYPAALVYHSKKRFSRKKLTCNK